MNIDEIYQVGDVVRIKLGSAISYDEITGLPTVVSIGKIPIDLNWGMNGFLFDYPDDRNSDYFCHDGDEVTILSKGLRGPARAKSYIFQVRDKNNKTFYLSCEYFHEPVKYTEYTKQEKIARLKEQLEYAKKELQALGEAVD